MRVLKYNSGVIDSNETYKVNYTNQVYKVYFCSIIYVVGLYHEVGLTANIHSFFSRLSATQGVYCIWFRYDIIGVHQHIKTPVYVS